MLLVDIGCKELSRIVKLHFIVHVSQRALVNTAHRNGFQTLWKLFLIQFHLDGDANGHCLIIITQSLIVPYNIRENQIFFPRPG